MRAGSALEPGELDEPDAGTQLLPVVPGGRPVAVLHHLLAEHGAQPHQQDPLRHLLTRQGPQQAQHEGEETQVKHSATWPSDSFVV